MGDRREPFQRLERLAPQREPTRRPAAQVPLALRGRHPGEGAGDPREDEIRQAALEEPQQPVELRAIGGAGERRDPVGDPLGEVGCGRGGEAVDERRRDRAEDRQPARAQRAWTKLSLKPSGSEIMNSRSPHGMSFGS